MCFQPHKRKFHRRCKWLLVGCVSLQLHCAAQQKQIDSLKQVIPTLKDTAFVEGVYTLTEFYFQSGQFDSIPRNVEKTLETARRIGYAHGLAIGSMQKGGLLLCTQNDCLHAQKFIRESLNWFAQTPNKEHIDRALCILGMIKKQTIESDGTLDTLQLAYRLATAANDVQWIGGALENITDIYRDRGDYVKLLETQQKLVEWDRKNGDTSEYSFHEKWVLGLMYRLLEDYKAAVPFWRRVFMQDMGGNIGAWNTMEYAELLMQAGLLDSARYYYTHFDSLHSSAQDLRFFLVSKGEYFLFLQQFTTALPYLMQGLAIDRQRNDHRQMNRVIIDIAKTYAALSENDSALHYARQGLTMALLTEAKPLMRDAYEILYNVFNRLQVKDSAFVYYRDYIKQKEAVMNDQTKGKLAAYNYEHKIDVLAKEKKAQQQEIAQASFQKKLLLFGIGVILLLSFFILRSIVLKRRNEHHLRKIAEQELQVEKLKWQQQASELEMQALRAQMNPHFIFNSLNSINRFILKNEKKQASEYLTKFSRLVRLILQNSQSSLITLDSELECLRLYLELEALRFDHHFIYRLDVEEELDTKSTRIPPLIIQPYVENAIWHGLMHKEEKGHLSIVMTSDNVNLICKVTDDGVGRKKAAEMKSKSTSLHKSMGLRITADRISMMQRDDANGSNAVTIHDLTLSDGSPGGTEVVLCLPLMQ